MPVVHASQTVTHVSNTGVAPSDGQGMIVLQNGGCRSAMIGPLYIFLLARSPAAHTQHWRSSHAKFRLACLLSTVGHTSAHVSTQQSSAIVTTPEARCCRQHRIHATILYQDSKTTELPLYILYRYIRCGDICFFLKKIFGRIHTL